MIRLFTKPSAFEGNPYGYAMNQTGHAALGALWVWMGWPLWLWVALYVSWEAAQWVMFDAQLADAFEDAAFAIGGALAIANLPVAVVLVLFLAVGIATRARGARSDRH
jgi:hypothetical protein